MKSSLLSLVGSLDLASRGWLGNSSCCLSPPVGFTKTTLAPKKTKLKKFERFLRPPTAKFLNLRSTFCKTPFVNPQSALRPLVCSLHTVARRLHFVHPCNPKPSLRPCTLSLSFLLFLSFVVFPLHPLLCFLFLFIVLLSASISISVCSPVILQSLPQYKVANTSRQRIRALLLVGQRLAWIC